jgi:hypothetical protein
MLTYGVATVRGCNVTLTQIGWPGKYKGCNPDAPGSVSQPDPTIPGVGSAKPTTNPLQAVPGGVRDYNPNQIGPMASQ